MPNPVLPRWEREQMSAPLQAVWDRSIDTSGDATFVAVGANNPDFLQWYIEDFYDRVFYDGTVSARIMELLRLRLSNIHGCRYCNKGNTQTALAAGVTQQQIDSLFDYEQGPFSDAEKAALRLADQIVLTNDDGHLTPELYAQLKPHFDDAQIFQMGMVLGMLSGVAKFLFVYDLVEREPTCPFPMPEARAAG